MNGLAPTLVLLAAAAVLPARPSPAVARIRALDADRDDRPSRPRVPFARLRGGAAASALGGGAAFAGAAHLAFGARLPILPTLAGLLAGGAAGLVVSNAAASRHSRRRDSALVESVSALAADLRAGQQPRGAVAAMRVGPAPGGGQSAAVAAVWAVSERSGAPAAAVLDRVEQDLRAREHQHREVAAQLAGARSTAALLAVLPVLGIGLGAAMGARPLDVLFGTPAGQVALVVGTGLDALGVLWTLRIITAAGGER